MILYMRRLPPLRGPDGDGYKGAVPARALQMQPEAADALLKINNALAGDLVLTDIYRSPEEILRAKIAKPAITQPPGWSAHGFGFSFDFDVDATVKRTGIQYAELSDMFGEYGYYCHRRDGVPDKSEGWHFNFLGLGPDAQKYITLADVKDHHTWAQPVEQRIQDLYGPQLMLSFSQIESQLTASGYDLGHGLDICVKMFQRDWDLPADGIPGRVTQRTLAFISAEIVYSS